ncbi:Sec-independent protein translocase subunit TatA/TatB [Daejeonella oryzae]|uniref:Sec-independent protein translocase subunit TatA/TatB n=1 Tax=Daejeonella oryzae TaxID=1122943 RepID=UPI000414C765|nr:twin-arginine translocase TatA/TatE family subunit [Daejeonella oryzae]
MYSSTLLFMNMGTPEILVIMFVVLLLFGGKKLPELARGLGKGIREFKDASDGVKREIHNNINSVNSGIDLNGPAKKDDTIFPEDDQSTTETLKPQIK